MTAVAAHVSWGLYDTGVLAWRNLLRILRNPWVEDRHRGPLRAQALSTLRH